MPRGAWFDVHTLSRYEKPDERIRRILLADVERSDTRQGFEFPETVSIFNAKGPPVPIPNTEVKLCSADNTCLETSREDRSMLTPIGHSNAKGPPVPIPNTEVKLCSADNTCLETGRKDRSWPIQSKQESVRFPVCLIFLLSSVG